MATQTQTNAPANAPQAGTPQKGGKKVVKITDIERKMQEIVERVKILDELLSETERRSTRTTTRSTACGYGCGYQC